MKQSQTILEHLRTYTGEATQELSARLVTTYGRREINRHHKRQMINSQRPLNLIFETDTSGQLNLMKGGEKNDRHN